MFSVPQGSVLRPILLLKVSVFRKPKTGARQGKDRMSENLQSLAVLVKRALIGYIFSVPNNTI